MRTFTNFFDVKLSFHIPVCNVLVSFFHNCRGSAELLEESGGNLSPADSMTSIPTCMPFTWFGDKERDRDRDREPSSSSSSLPYAATETSSEQSHERKNKVCNLLLNQCEIRSLAHSLSVNYGI